MEEKTSAWHDSPGYFDRMNMHVNNFGNYWGNGYYDNANDQLELWFGALPIAKDTDEFKTIKELMNKSKKILKKLSYQREDYSYSTKLKEELKELQREIYFEMHRIMHLRNMLILFNEKRNPGEIMKRTVYG